MNQCDILLTIENLPYKCSIGQNKLFKINLNQYRNAHFFTLSKAKNWFNDWGAIQNLERIKTIDIPVCFIYKIWLRRGSDLMNYGSILDKFVCDMLIKRKLLKDDNASIIREVRFIFMGYIKTFKATLEIKEVKSELEKCSENN